MGEDKKPATKRRRIRRRKKSKYESSFLSSSSSSSSSSEDESVDQGKKTTKPNLRSKKNSSSESESSSSSDSEAQISKKKVDHDHGSSDTNSSSSEEEEGNLDKVNENNKEKKPEISYQRTSPPPLVNLTDPSIQQRFRSVYLAQIAQEFGEELDTIRKTELVSMSTSTSKKNGPIRSKEAIEESRLEILIDALASGVDVFDQKEMEMMLPSQNEDVDMVEP